MKEEEKMGQSKHFQMENSMHVFGYSTTSVTLLPAELESASILIVFE